MKWKYFGGACLVVGGALLKAGAPVLGILAGLGLAALANFLRYRHVGRAQRTRAAGVLSAGAGRGSAVAKAR